MYCYTKWLLNVKIFQVISGGRYFGSKHITNTQLSKINDSSVLKLICDLLSLIYEKTELRNSSLTRSVANANKSLNLDKKSTEKLDPVRLKAIESKKILQFNITCAYTYIKYIIYLKSSLSIWIMHAIQKYIFIHNWIWLIDRKRFFILFSFQILFTRNSARQTTIQNCSVVLFEASATMPRKKWHPSIKLNNLSKTYS